MSDFLDRLFEVDDKIRKLLDERARLVYSEATLEDSPWLSLGEIIYPVQIDQVVFSERPFIETCREIGSWVSVRIAGETRLGILVGNISYGAMARLKKSTNATVFEVGPGPSNPAMWVPSLGRIVFGFESWWRTIEKPEDLVDISDADITGTWYVQALTEISNKAQDEVKP